LLLQVQNNLMNLIRHVFIKLLSLSGEQSRIISPASTRSFRVFRIAPRLHRDFKRDRGTLSRPSTAANKNSDEIWNSPFSGIPASVSHDTENRSSSTPKILSRAFDAGDPRTLRMKESQSEGRERE